jgi:GT2 family glycosyltransferase
MEHKNVYSIILTLNNADVFPSLYRSLAKKTNYPITNIIVDNGSTDRTKDYINKFKREKDIFLNLPVNIGVTAGWNYAIRHLRAQNITPDYIALLNSDLEVADDWLKPMIDVFEKGKIGMVDNLLKCSRIKSFVQSDGPMFTRLYEFPYWMTSTPEYKPKLEPQPVQWATMACCLIKYEVFNEIGLFDENFVIYSSDFDLQIRMRMAGLELWHCPSSVAYHKAFHTCEKVRKTDPKIAKIMVDDGLYFKNKWGTGIMEEFQTSTGRIPARKEVL